MLYETRNALLTHFENLRRHEELKIIVQLGMSYLTCNYGTSFPFAIAKERKLDLLSFYSTGDKSSFPLYVNLFVAILQPVTKFYSSGK